MSHSRKIADRLISQTYEERRKMEESARRATWNPIKRSPASIFIRRVWCGWRLETARKWNGCIGATATMPWKQKRDDRARGKKGRRSERDPKWNQPKRLSGSEFPHGTEDHRYRKPSTGNLASGSEGFPPSLFHSPDVFRSFNLHFSLVYAVKTCTTYRQGKWYERGWLNKNFERKKGENSFELSFFWLNKRIRM